MHSIWTANPHPASGSHCLLHLDHRVYTIVLTVFSLAAADTTFLGLTQQEFERAPVYIVVEVLAAAGLCLWGELLHTPQHHPVTDVTCLINSALRSASESYKLRAESS